MKSKRKKDIVIKVENLGKKYQIGTGQSHLSLRETLANLAKLPQRLIIGKTSKKKSHFWALKNVSFEVKKGEVLGVIGKNGAGKTTLLKILSRITEPTTGKVTLKGRVASLLEVGTGFHPELTGRENVYLSGVILGMKKREINRKFEKIVDFSGIKKFLDTPVKRYSSGMWVRLAFSVVAHLDPEILLVDEVLAVGDTVFQKKSIQKMSEVTKKAGRTILFVSHNMDAIQSLCQRTILLENGKIKMMGETSEVIRKYLSALNSNRIPLKKRRDRMGDGRVKIEDFVVLNQDGEDDIKSFDRLKILIKFDEDFQRYDNFQLIIAFYDLNERGLFRTDTGTLKTLKFKNNRLKILTGEVNLVPLNCHVNVVLLIEDEISDYINDVYRFDILKNTRAGVKNFNKKEATILLETSVESQ